MAGRKISASELAEANTADKCWVAIENEVYDATSFLNKHPGGPKVLLCVSGRDATFPFTLYHKKEVSEKYLKHYWIGTLEEGDETTKDEKMVALTEDYKQLYRYLQENGWFETEYTYYYKKAAIYAVLFMVSLRLMMGSCLLLGLVGCVGLGMFWQQIAFLGHDLGHNAVTHDNFKDNLFGFIVGNLLGGISLGWWKHTHNVHHIRTNDIYHDPDIQHLPVFCISSKFFQGIYSEFHDRIFEFVQSPAAQFFVKNQDLLSFPLILLARWNLYFQSWLFVHNQYFVYVKKNPSVKIKVIGEAVTLFLFAVWNFVFFVAYTEHPIIYAFLSNLVAGILHVQIVSNHFPMPALEDLNENFFVHQIQSSMDMKSTVYTDWFHGGLQYQVEHHLFPQLPRHNLRNVKPFVKQLCSKYNLPYMEDSLLNVIPQIHRLMKRVAHEANVFEASQTF